MKRIKAHFFARRFLYGGAAVLFVAAGWFWFGRGSNSAAEIITVAPKAFIETVDVSGQVTPAHDVDLGFAQGGRIAHVYVAVGDPVSQGTTLAEVENSDLRAGVLQQQAVLAEQQAKLQSLKAGAQPEDIAASQAALDKAQQDLNNLYLGIIDVSQDGYTKSNDAIRTQLSSIFLNGESNNPGLSFSTNNIQAQTDAQNGRAAASVALNSWAVELGDTHTKPDTLLTDSLSYLTVVRNALSSVSAALDGANALSDTTRAAYRASVVTGQAEVNTAVKNLNATAQSISSQKLTVAQAQAQLNLKRAGATADDIAAQAAAVTQAEAAVENAQAQLQKTLITAPFGGTITRVDAKSGLAVSANAPQISMQSNGTFQIESYVPEVNIASVAVGNTATVTLDAYGPDVSFSASVVSIDPAETVRDGVSTYRVVLQFSKQDDRIKSGMTASLSITTKQVNDALTVPLGAVFQKNGGSMLQLRREGDVVDVPVVLGDNSGGMVEVRSGLSTGDQVVLNPDTAR